MLRNRLAIAPHMVIRGLCIYLGVVGLLWTWFGLAVEDDTFVYADRRRAGLP